jgi:hypothetical protein
MRRTVEQLRELLSYDPDTGKLTWIKRGRGRWGAVGDVDRRGYAHFRFAGSHYYAHRVAWAIHHGREPENQIDHINGIKTDNRLVNLRDVPQHINMQNQRRPQSRNTTGWLGVSSAPRGMFTACIWLDGKPKSLGRYETPEFAHGKYLSVKRALHPGCTI